MSLKDVYSVVQLELVHVHYISVCIFNIIDGICAALLVFFIYSAVQIKSKIKCGLVGFNVHSDNLLTSRITSHRSHTENLELHLCAGLCSGLKTVAQTCVCGYLQVGPHTQCLKLLLGFLFHFFPFEEGEGVPRRISLSSNNMQLQICLLVNFTMNCLVVTAAAM